MKKGVKQVISGMALFLAVVGGWLLWPYFQVPELPTGFASGNGRIEATEYDIATKRAGRVEKVLV